MNGAGFFTSTVDWNNQFWPANQQTEEYQECIDLRNGFGLAAGGSVKGGLGSVYESTDNGLSWQIAQIPDKTPWLHDVFVGGSLLFAVGDGGNILTRDKFVAVTDPDATHETVSLSANPVAISTSLILNLPVSQMVSVALFDVSGKLVRLPYQNHLVNEGISRLTLPLIGLRAGTYQVLVTYGKTKITKLLVVQ
ncbi:MAG: T9SS type A sorting domain-containing protein [Bacteroidales bacterium]|nr:T9SS type A sorting domain-containing protein [Bacteroidales bacterium]